MNEKQEITIRAGEADDIVNTFCDCVNRSAVVSSAVTLAPSVRIV